jgi:hypothetical protein
VVGAIGRVAAGPGTTLNGFGFFGSQDVPPGKLRRSLTTYHTKLLWHSLRHSRECAGGVNQQGPDSLIWLG